MEDNAKVFVFEKKEIFLIFVFVVIMSVTCFTLGVNLGKKLALEKADITSADTKVVEMKSSVEEDADSTGDMPKMNDEEKLDKMMEDSKNRLNQELQQGFSNEEGEKPKTEEATTATAAVPVTKPAVKASEVTTATEQTGKYTIQLGSYNSMDEAKQFAEGFTVRGYNPIINEVIIAEKGTWYRVSLGLFETTAAAREYIKKEATLFQGQDYVISEIK
ncbi:MAG: SPOR domain-containing protein [Bacteriovoracaceae bacterium]|nr:SPOR domain-containing protein [Bacteriovoracaceae bacterium]